MALNDPSSWKRKYWKPESMTWLPGAASLAAGLMVATEPAHGMTGIVASIDNLTGGVAPSVLIASGMTIIGIRGSQE